MTPSTAQGIAEELQVEIAAGRLPPGAKLPAVRDLAAQYDVSRNTVTKALSLLKSAGLVITRHGSGAYVRESHPVRRLGPDRYARHHWQHTTVQAYADATSNDGVQQQGHQTQEVNLVPATEPVAAALGIEPATLVYERARVMTREGSPTHTMTSYYRREDVEGTPLTDAAPGIAGPRGGFQILTDQGLPPDNITEELQARMPTAEETLLLDLPSGEPVVEVRRTTRTADDRVIEYAEGIHAASRFSWSYTFPIPD